MPVDKPAYPDDRNPHRPYSILSGIPHRQDWEAIIDYAEKTGYFSSLLDLERAKQDLKTILANSAACPRDLSNRPDDSPANERFLDRLLKRAKEALQGQQKAIKRGNYHEATKWKIIANEFAAIYYNTIGNTTQAIKHEKAAMQAMEERESLIPKEISVMAGGMNQEFQEVRILVQELRETQYAMREAYQAVTELTISDLPLAQSYANLMRNLVIRLRNDFLLRGCTDQQIQTMLRSQGTWYGSTQTPLGEIVGNVHNLESMVQSLERDNGLRPQIPYDSPQAWSSLVGRGDLMDRNYECFNALVAFYGRDTIRRAGTPDEKRQVDADLYRRRINWISIGRTFGQN
jgi:hypothetical protein